MVPPPEHTRDISQDIRDFLCRGFDEIAPLRHLTGWPPPETIDTLVQRSCGRLAYSSTVLKFVGDRGYDPKKQLDCVISLDSTSESSALDQLYIHILSTIPAGHPTSLPYRIIACILLTGQVFSARMIESLLVLQSGEVSHILGHLRSLFDISTNDGPILSYQKSFSDFIFSQKRAKEFYIDPKLQHAHLAHCCFRYMKSWHTGVTVLDVPEGPPASINLISDVAGYATNNCIAHCRQVKDPEEQEMLYNTFKGIGDTVWEQILFSHISSDDDTVQKSILAPNLGLHDASTDKSLNLRNPRLSGTLNYDRSRLSTSGSTFVDKTSSNLPSNASLPTSRKISTSSLALPLSFDSKRHPRLKEGHFQYKYGQRFHSYDIETAPYPLSYDRHVLEIESMDNRFFQHLAGSVSFMNFKEEPPERILDLGCGTGIWIIEAAKTWPTCKFVGFDLVNIQISHQVLDKSIAERIDWKHGNFLTRKLPFDDDEFDHVHVQGIAKGVPESKWRVLFKEINRVLRPGGSVEVVEDDVVFPRLPRWFTNELRARPRRATSVHLPDGTQHKYPLASNILSKTIPPHDHALLESLVKSVFEHRLISLKPTAVLPSYLMTYFRHVTLGPVINFPMPPFPPLQPLPPQIATTYVTPDTLDPRASTVFSAPMGRPASLSFSSTSSASTISTADSSSHSHNPSMFSSQHRTTSAFLSSTYESPNSSITADQLDGSTRSPPPKTHPHLPYKQFILDGSLSESEIAAIPPSLFPIKQLKTLSERSLAMHLYKSYQTILACQEAMWEELKDRLRNRKDELVPYGWEDNEGLEELQTRKRFERLVEQYRSDMQSRISIWCSLTGIGWPFPARDPMSKAELIEEGRIRDSMLEALRFASEEDQEIPCRSVRILVGYKL